MRGAVTMRVTRAARVSATRRTAASPSSVPSAMRHRAFWPFSRTRQKRPAAASSPQTGPSPSSSTSPSAPSVVLPASTGRALRALGPRRDRHDRLAFGFSAGGLLFPYYVGVAYSLRESGALVPGVTPLAGASAGSLIAACVGTGLGREEVEVRGGLSLRAS